MDLKEHLNPEQAKAAAHVEGPMLVIAGAGSGKTRIVTYRIVHLLELGVPANEILALTFTNKAADEMRDRIQRLSQKAILASTFHSLGARILRESIASLGYTSSFAIFDEEDSNKVVKEFVSEKKKMKEVRSAISNAKNALIDPDELAKEDAEMGKFYALYQERLKTYNAVDFDDLLFLTVKLFTTQTDILSSYQKRWNFLLVDEYQDTNQAQYQILKLLSAKHQNVFAVGDPDQSIYSWRGANVANILNFEKDYPGAKVVPLEQNYRSTNTILDASNALITNNEGRYEKKLWSDRGEGEKIGFCICESERDEVNFVMERLYHHHYKLNTPLSDCVIFYRTHFQSRAFEDALLKERVPYIIIGGISFYMRREIKDILAFLRVALAPTDFLAFSRTLNLEKRGIGPASLAKIRNAARPDLIGGCLHILDGSIPLKLSARQKTGLASYIKTVTGIQHAIRQGPPIDELLRDTIDLSNYEAILKEDPDTFEDRKGNLDELISKAVEWQDENEGGTLIEFLEELTLKSNADLTEGQDALRLMTLHNGKGLEFDTAFLVGMEEELLPHMNSLGNFEALEEERRLCYVGMTRAKNNLYLTAARSRYLWGTSRWMRPSRFLAEIPEIHLNAYHLQSFSSPEQETSTNDFRPGDRVSHRDFGAGTVQKTYETSLGLTYDVLFDGDLNLRSLVARYAKLSRP